MKNLRLHNPTLRVINILNAIYLNSDGLTLTELSKATNIPKGTLHPIVTTLLHEEILRNYNSKLTIGKSCFKIGSSYIQSLDYLDILRPYMLDIVSTCGEICQVGILDGNEVLYVEKREPKQSIRIESYVGKTLFAYATAIGKMLLSDLSKDEILSLYKDDFYLYTPKTVKNHKELFEQLDKIKEQGYAHEVGETNPDVECIAVPIVIKGRIKAALSVSLPLFRSNKEKLEQIKKILIKQASAISGELKHTNLDF